MLALLLLILFTLAVSGCARDNSEEEGLYGYIGGHTKKLLNGEDKEEGFYGYRGRGAWNRGYWPTRRRYPYYWGRYPYYYGGRYYSPSSYYSPYSYYPYSYSYFW